MITYALITYALACVAFVFTCMSFMRVLWGIHFQVFTKAFFGILVFTLALLSLNGKSVAIIFYNLCDMPSFLLFFVCIFTILRNFIEQINFTMSYFGLLYIFILWVLLVCNAFGIFDWAYGSLAYKFLLVAIFSAFAYSFDRVCGTLMLFSIMLWLPFSNTFDIYNMLFDPIVALFCFMLQSIPIHKNNFHVTLFRPKTR